MTYLACDLDRRRAAGELHIHPNTLDYRLRRVTALTGLDVNTTQGIQLAGAALIARRLTAYGTSSGGASAGLRRGPGAEGDQRRLGRRMPAG